MPQDYSRLYFHDGLDGKGQRYFWILDLNTDATSFWSVIERHALDTYRPAVGGNIRWMVQGLENQIDQGSVPLVAEFVYVFRIGGWSPETIWAGATLAWESLGPARLRVVVGPTNDLLSNLLAASRLLDAIWKVYPESRGDLHDYERKLSDLAYTEDVKTAFLEYVRQVTALRAIEQSKTHRPTVYGESDTRSTLAQYLHKEKGKSKRTACQLLRLSPTTLSKHEREHKLLTDREFQQRTGMSLALAAEHPEEFGG